MTAIPTVKALAAALCLASAAPSFALDLLQAYRSALRNDAQLAAARAQLQVIRERVPQARAGLLPAVSAGASLMRQNTDTNLAPVRRFTSQSYSVSVSYPLFRLQNVELFEQTKLQVGAGEAQLAQATQDLVLRVSQAYFDLLAAHDNVSTLESQIRAITEQLASAKRNFEVGTATITDQQEAQARYDLAVAQEIAARNDLEVKRAALAQLIGQPVGDIDGLRPGVRLNGPEPARESEWASNARESNFTVLQQQIAAEIARREIDRQRYARYPVVDLVGSVSYGQNSAVNFIGVRSTNAAVGVQLSVPLYTGGLIDARVREAAASLDQSSSTLESLRRQAEQSARQAYLGLSSGLAQVNALEAAERSSRLALDSNLLGYQVGVRINIDVLNAQQQLFQTRRDLARARYDALLNGLRLQATAGALGEEDVQAVNALLTPIGTSGQEGPSTVGTPQPPLQMTPMPAPGAAGTPVVPGAPGAPATVPPLPGAPSSQGIPGASPAPLPGSSLPGQRR
ncbi:MAG: TolC family outer membrane protein [Burkholderiales bacterium]|nr:TolC family outer membrane protein [Burkholderiales bacterium]